jgi:hypothetical protein
MLLIVADSGRRRCRHWLDRSRGGGIVHDQRDGGDVVHGRRDGGAVHGQRGGDVVHDRRWLYMLFVEERGGEAGQAGSASPD